MRRRQKPIFSSLAEVEIEPLEEKVKFAAPVAAMEIAAEPPRLAPVPESHCDQPRVLPAAAGLERAAADQPLSAPPSGKVKLSTDWADFGQVSLGEHQDRMVMVFNDGPGEVIIQGFQGLPANGFSLVDPPEVPQGILPHGSMGLRVRFAPVTLGKQAAALVIAVPEGGSPSSVIGLAGRASAAVHAAAGEDPSILYNSLGMPLVYMPPVIFGMGSPAHELGRNGDETLHEVMLSKGFYMQATPVTQGQWQAIMPTNPSNFADRGADLPVEGVSWDDCQEFIKRLNGLGEGTYRLPTEAEWEYACRAGSRSALANGEIAEMFCELDPNLDAMAWYYGNSGRCPHPVGEKTPNGLGLYDMHGNVAEWCGDWYGEYPADPEIDPQGAPSGPGRVIRGGSWFSSAKNCRSACRFYWPPNQRNNFTGFRLVREL